MKSKTKTFNKKHPYLWNMTVAIAACALLIGFTGVALSIFTHHGEAYAVPDFTNISLPEAQIMAEEHDLELVVTDSVSINYRPRGIVFRQTPKSGTMVKKHRHIFLIINSLTPRMVEMPNVVGYSLRQAKTVLLSKNLHVGKLHYVPDMATNNVLQQKYKGQSLPTGAEVPADSYIDLELGLNSGANRTIIPVLTGYTYTEARDALVEASLNNGALHYDKTITTYTDSLIARVYKQTPAASDANIWTLGLKVELWLTMDDSKIKE